MERLDQFARAFVVCGIEPLGRYLASVDDVERQTGLDFFHELADAQEQALEAVGAVVPPGLRAQTTVQDLIAFAPVYAGIVAAGWLPGAKPAPASPPPPSAPAN